MAGFNDVLKSLGYATGAVTGGPSQLKAVGGLVKVNGSINDYLFSLGKKIGTFTGSNAFESLADGAKTGSEEETKAFVETNILPRIESKYTVWIILAILGVGFFIFKRFHK